MARQILVEILGDASKFSNSTKTATSSATNFSNVLKGIGQGVGIAAFANISNVASTVASSVVDFAKDSINAASNLNEAITLSDQVFEDNGKAVQDWAATAARSFGESQREALNYASNFGTAFKNVGYSLDDATKSAEDMTRLAADLGSAFNKSSDEAANALRSGLLGESEPLRKFGVFLDEAKVKAKALAMGMTPVNGAFTDGQKVMARYQLILEQTGDSQGMFGRDANSLEDSQKTLNAQMENLQATLGKQLLPVMVKFTQYLSDEVVPTLQDSVNWIDENQDSINLLGTAFGFVVNPIQTANDVAHDWAGVAREGTGPTNDIANAITHLRREHQAMSPALDATSDALRNAGQPTRNETTYLQGLRDAAKESGDKIRTLKDITNEWFDVIDQRNEPTVLRGNLADLKTELKGVNDRIAVLQGMKYRTPAQQRELDGLLGQQASLRGEIDKTKIKIGQTNHASLGELRAEYKSLKKNGIVPATRAMRDLYNEILRARGLDIRIDVTTGQKRRASGGPASGLTWIGERGPELVDMPPGSYVYNNARSMQMAGESARTVGTPAGGGSTVNVYIQGPIYGGPQGLDELQRMIALRMRMQGV